MVNTGFVDISNEVKSLLRSNCTMTADEERAIIEAYKAQNSYASTYISFASSEYYVKSSLVQNDKI